MAEDKIEGREATWRQLLPWTELFRGFQVALDLNKLLLAASGILVMAFGWWLLAWIFGAGFAKVPPSWPERYKNMVAEGNEQKAWELFKRDRDEWNLMYEAAGGSVGDFGQKYEALDLASSLKEFNDVTAALQDSKYRETVDTLLRDKKISEVDVNAALKDSKGDVKPAIESLVRDKKISEAEVNAALKDSKGDKKLAIESLVRDKKFSEQKGRVYLARLDKYKRFGVLATWPWFEDRGPNPYLLVTGQAGIPWEAGRFWDWFVRDQLLVMIEPLVKFVQPIIYFFSPRSTGYTSFYFLCVMLWTLAAWALFGGAITRISAVQVARGEKIGLREAVRFTLKRILSYLMAPLFPLAFVFLMLIFMVIFGVIHMIPVFGDIAWDGLLWPVMLIFGLVMAVTLVGLVGWPLMSATISTEGTDSWEAVSRSYSYVYQKPWHYIWYSLVAIAYGSVLVFFVGFMGSLTVYLAKWGVSQTPFIAKADREPSFLFVYAPTSFGWRTLLLEGTTTHGEKIVDNGEIQQSVYDDYLGRTRSDGTVYEGKDKNPLTWWNKFGAVLVAIWLFLVFLLLLGFGYSYFWSASTIIYLLMRRHVDAAEMDEVYLEEDDQEGPYGGHFTPPVPPATSAVKPPASVTMIESPTLRTPASAPTPAPMAPLTTPPLSPPTVSSPPPEPSKAPEPAPLPPTSPPTPQPERDS